MQHQAGLVSDDVALEEVEMGSIKSIKHVLAADLIQTFNASVYLCWYAVVIGEFDAHVFISRIIATSGNSLDDAHCLGATVAVL